MQNIHKKNCMTIQIGIYLPVKIMYIIDYLKVMDWSNDCGHKSRLKIPRYLGDQEGPVGLPGTKNWLEHLYYL